MATVNDLINRTMRLVGEESSYGYDSGSSGDWISWTNEAQNFIVVALNPSYFAYRNYPIQGETVAITATYVNMKYITIGTLTKEMLKLISIKRFESSQVSYYSIVPLSQVDYYLRNKFSVDDNSPIAWVDGFQIFLYEQLPIDGITRDVTYIHVPTQFTATGTTYNYSEIVAELLVLHMASSAKKKMEDYNEADKFNKELIAKISFLNGTAPASFDYTGKAISMGG